MHMAWSLANAFDLKATACRSSFHSLQDDDATATYSGCRRSTNSPVVCISSFAAAVSYFLSPLFPFFAFLATLTRLGCHFGRPRELTDVSV